MDRRQDLKNELIRDIAQAKHELDIKYHRRRWIPFTTAILAITVTTAWMYADQYHVNLELEDKIIFIKAKQSQIHPDWLCTDGLTMTYNNKPVCGPY